MTIINESLLEELIVRHENSEPTEKYQTKNSDNSLKDGDQILTQTNNPDFYASNYTYGEPSIHFKTKNEVPITDVMNNLFEATNVTFCEPDVTYQKGNSCESKSTLKSLLTSDEYKSILNDAEIKNRLIKEGGSNQTKELKYLDYIIYKQLMQKYHFKCCHGITIYLYLEQYGCYQELRDNDLKVLIRRNVTPDIDKRLSEYKILEVIKRLKSCAEIQVTNEEFDQHLHLINFLNGVFDTKNGRMIEHNPQFMFTSYINANFPQKFPSDRSFVKSRRSGSDEWIPHEGRTFLNFINECTQGNLLKIKTIRQIFAYCISNYSNAKKFFVFLGKAHSGKSLLSNILKEIVGRNHTSGVPLHELGGRFQTAELFNKKLNLSSEIGEGIAKGGDVIKALVGGDLVKAERKGEHPFFFVNKAKIIAVGNAFPNISGLDKAMIDRITLVTFDYSVKEEDRDKSLYEKIQFEKSFIVYWALQELLELEANNFVFTESEDAIEFKSQFLDRMDSITHFFEDMCQVDCNNKSLRVHRKQLFEAYNLYCRNNCIKACGQDEFFNEVIKLGVKKDKFRMPGTSPLRGYVGIKLDPQ